MHVKITVHGWSKSALFFQPNINCKKSKNIHLNHAAHGLGYLFFHSGKTASSPPEKTEGGDPRATLPLDPPPLEPIFFSSKKTNGLRDSRSERILQKGTRIVCILLKSYFGILPKSCRRSTATCMPVTPPLLPGRNPRISRISAIPVCPVVGFTVLHPGSRGVGCIASMRDINAIAYETHTISSHW